MTTPHNRIAEFEALHARFRAQQRRHRREMCLVGTAVVVAAVCSALGLYLPEPRDRPFHYANAVLAIGIALTALRRPPRKFEGMPRWGYLFSWFVYLLMFALLGFWMWVWWMIYAGRW